MKSVVDRLPPLDTPPVPEDPLQQETPQHSPVPRRPALWTRAKSKRTASQPTTGAKYARTGPGTAARGDCSWRSLHSNAQSGRRSQQGRAAARRRHHLAFFLPRFCARL